MAREVYCDLTLDHIIDNTELLKVLENRLGIVVIAFLKDISDGGDNGIYESAEAEIRKITTILFQ